MQPIYFTNSDQTRGFKLVGRDLTRVDFKVTQLGADQEIECRVRESKASAEDVMRIRREFTETNAESYEFILHNVMGHIFKLLGNKVNSFTIHEA